MIKALHLQQPTVAVGNALIDLAAQHGYNVIIWNGTRSVRFTSFPSALWVPTALTLDEYTTMVARVKSHGMSFVHHHFLLTHQINWLGGLATYRHLWYNAGGSEYNPNHPTVQTYVKNLINETVELADPIAILIGHDEVTQAAVPPLPPNLFLDSVYFLHNHIKSHGIKTWMWGDQIISAAEFPTVGNCNGAFLNYYTYRPLIPKDIVICDWHYTQTPTTFPSSVALMAEGRDVIAVTWSTLANIKAFHKYAQSIGTLGRMTTLWSLTQDDETAKGIIRASAGALWT